MMKHPPANILQDYFENALTGSLETRVRAHLVDCDHCTQILADFTRIEHKVQKAITPSVSPAMEQKIMTDALRILAERRKDRAERVELQTKRQRQREEFVSDWRERLEFDWRVPALQFASVSALLVILVAIEQNSGEESIYRPISNEVQEVTYQDAGMREGK
jgi:anti-sigma factor ChrR (cupin superfamily)